MHSHRLHCRPSGLGLAPLATCLGALALIGASFAAFGETGAPASPGARTPIAPAELAARYPAESRYGIWRKGDRIGEHVLRFSNADGLLQVDVESRIRVTMLAIPVFRYDYRARERWNEAALTSVEVRISENGEVLRTAMRSDASGSVLSGPDGERSVPRVEFASNHWHRGVLATERLFNTLTGELSEVRIDAIGRDTLRAARADGTPLSYTRYRYRGDIAVESWYDDQGRWVGLAFDGEDGSRIEYRLEH